MRAIIITVFLFAVPVLVAGQDHARVKLRCPANMARVQDPIIIVDGSLREYAELNLINPDVIESIDVLKGGNAMALFGCRAINGAVLITTKERSFGVRDIEDGRSIPGATVSFVPTSGMGDTVISVTDDRGFIITRELKKGETYNVGISSIGYKRSTVLYKNKNGAATVFAMEREIISCSPVVVIASGPTIRCWRYCCVTGIAITNCETIKETGLQKTGNTCLVYPNPVQKGAILSIELNATAVQTIIVKILNLNGQILSEKTTATLKGYNRYVMTIDQRWAAGVYFIQVAASQGKILKQEKILVQ